MNWTINELMTDTTKPMRRGYWKITTVSFLMILLSTGLSYASLIRSVNDLPELIQNVISREFSGRTFDSRTIAVLLTLVGGMLLISVIIKLLIDVFLENPLEIGADRMFLNAMDEEAPVMLADLAFAYDADYINAVKILFFRKLKTDLWTVLLVVPGIIKHYEYLMIPYLLSEDPYMDMRDAFAKSKQMMMGNKKKAFMLDVYFILWHLLGLITFGIAEVFYVKPKKNMVDACLYLKLKEIEGERE